MLVVSHELIKHIMANSNAYASKNLKGSNCAGCLWYPITAEEMFHVLGIILKLSTDNCQISGIHDQFSPPVKIFNTPGQSTKVSGFTNWAADVM